MHCQPSHFSGLRKGITQIPAMSDRAPAVAGGGRSGGEESRDGAEHDHARELEPAGEIDGPGRSRASAVTKASPLSHGMAASAATRRSCAIAAPAMPRREQRGSRRAARAARRLDRELGLARARAARSGASSSRPGMPQAIVTQKKVAQPMASTRKPLIGPGEDARQAEEAGEERVLRGREALLRHAQQQHREGAGAQPEVSCSKPMAPYISGRSTPGWSATSDVAERWRRSGGSRRSTASGRGPAPW